MTVKPEAPQKQKITFGKFENVDMRVARVLSTRPAEGTAVTSRYLELDLGHLGPRTSVCQYDLVPEEELVGRNVVCCVNLGDREIGAHISQVLVLGAPHPDSPPDEAQATPLYVSDTAVPGSQIF